MRISWEKILHTFLLLAVLLFLSSEVAALSLEQTKDKTNFLVFSDIHLDVLKTTPMQINPEGVNFDNDLDTQTLTTELQQIKQAIQDGTIQQPAFILILGDIAGYDRKYSDEIYNDESTLFKQINQFFPHTPIILTFGNNDSLEKDYGTFFYPSGVKDKHSSYEIAIANGWLDGFLSTGKYCIPFNTNYPCLINEDKIDGYFSTYIAPQMRLISINSVMFSASRHNTSSQADADKQLSWLQLQLEDVKIKGDSVLIASHIPFGYNIYDDSAFWREADRAPFYQLLSKYKKNIIGVLAGHTHMEELKVEQDTAKNNVGALIFTAALSTSHGNAPSVKTFFLTHKYFNWVLSNYETFYFLNNAANVFSLKKLYNFVDYYCANEESSAQNIFACLRNVTADKMLQYYSAGNPNYSGKMGAPDDIFVTLPNVSPAPVTTQGRSSSSTNWYGILGAAAAGFGIAAIGVAETLGK